MGSNRKYLLAEDQSDLLKILPIGAIKRVRAGGVSICLVNHKGEFIGFIDQCPHMKHPLSQGLINNYDEIICPLHSYRFHLKYGTEANHQCGSLEFLDVVEENGKIYIQI